MKVNTDPEDLGDLARIFEETIEEFDKKTRHL